MKLSPETKKGKKGFAVLYKVAIVMHINKQSKLTIHKIEDGIRVYGG